MQKVSVFIPVYNCEQILEKNILKVYEELLNLNLVFELVIVDDNSNDGTQEIAERLAKNKNILYKRFTNGPSRRENLALAMSMAKYNTIVMIDADLPVEPKYLSKLINGISEGYSVSTGSRFLGITPKRSRSRGVISKLYNSFMRFYFKSKVFDHQCGFKAFKKDIFDQTLNLMGYDIRFRRGWFWDVEILLRIQKLGGKIKEFPVEWKETSKSTFKVLRELKMIPYLFFNSHRIKNNIPTNVARKLRP